jgi:hypothetical protein
MHAEKGRTETRAKGAGVRAGGQGDQLQRSCRVQQAARDLRVCMAETPTGSAPVAWVKMCVAAKQVGIKGSACTGAQGRGRGAGCALPTFVDAFIMMAFSCVPWPLLGATVLMSQPFLTYLHSWHMHSGLHPEQCPACCAQACMLSSASIFNMAGLSLAHEHGGRCVPQPMEPQTGCRSQPAHGRGSM